MLDTLQMDPEASTGVLTPQMGPEAVLSKPQKKAAPPKPAATKADVPAASAQPVQSESMSMDAALKQMGDLEQQHFDAFKRTTPPQPQKQNEMSEWGALAIAVGAFASLRTRQPLMTAMNAAASAMNAMQQKNQQEFENSFQQWDQSVKLSLDMQKYELAAYQDRMRDWLSLRGQGVQEQRIGALEDIAAGKLAAGDKKEADTVELKKADLAEKKDWHKQLNDTKILALTLKDPTMMKEIDRGMADGGITKALENASNVMEKRASDIKGLKDRTLSLREKALEVSSKFRVTAALDEAKNTDEYKQKVADGDVTGAIQVLAQHAELADPTLFDKLDKAYVDPEKVRKTADAILHYRMNGAPFTSGRGMANTPFGRAVAQVVEEDPNYDETMFAAIKKLRADIATGKTGDRIASLTMLMGHMKTLESLVDALPADADYKAVNQVYNKFAEQYNVDITKYDTGADAVSHEFTNVLAGAKGSALDDREQAAVHFRRDYNKSQLKGNLALAKELVRSRIVADITRATPFLDMKPYIPPELQNYFGFELSGKGGKPPPEPEKPADNGVQKTSLQDAGGARAEPLGGAKAKAIPAEEAEKIGQKLKAIHKATRKDGSWVYEIEDGKWVDGDGNPVK